MNEELNVDSQALPEAIAGTRRRISIIWLLPVIAAIIGGWLFYDSIINAPVNVVIQFKTAEGIMADKTKVLYKGLPAGRVSDVSLSQKGDTVDVQIEFDPALEHLIRQDTEFWLVTPTVNMTGITGLETIVTGNYIAMRPGGGQPASAFKALDAPPPLDESAPGLHLILTSPVQPSVQHGSPVYYRRYEVGSVQTLAIAEDNQSFDIGIHILPEYQSLVSKQSRFWTASGFHVSGSISDLDIRIESFTAMLKGGIAFDTPNQGKTSAPVEDMEKFKLYEDYKEAQSGIAIFVRFATGQGLKPKSTSVRFKGIDIGVVEDVVVLPDLSGVTATVMMDPRANRALREGTQFWLVSPKVSLSEVSGLETIVGGTYIDVKPNLDGKPTRHFVALKSAPGETAERGQLEIILQGERRGSLKAGSPVYFRQVQVGEVSHSELASTGDAVNIYVIIYKRYVPLVRENSVFFNVSGMDFGLFSGLKTESLEALVAGGVAFATPEGDAMGKTVAKGWIFELHDEAQGSWLRWAPQIPLKLKKSPPKKKFPKKTMETSKETDDNESSP
ncbi:intermembrane transport protein PqiB [Desulfosarcina variabilis]|uniref:PqiB family protein n=1 Tax=Desulfosarcina variabilis TaxID=2300 RepID=UPI003AFB0C2D